MKHMNDSSSHYSVHSDDTSSSASNGRCLDIDEDSPFSDLSAVYACSDQAQFAALDATSSIFVREVAHYLGLAGPDLTVPYDFAPLAETVRRHCRRKRPRTSSTAGAAASAQSPASSASALRPLLAERRTAELVAECGVSRGKPGSTLSRFPTFLHSIPRRRSMAGPINTALHK